MLEKSKPIEIIIQSEIEKGVLGNADNFYLLIDLLIRKLLFPSAEQFIVTILIVYLSLTHTVIVLVII